MPARNVAGHALDAMMTNQVSAGTDRARQTLALLPILRQWVTARVHWAGADAGLSLRQYAALSGIRQGASSPGELARLWQVTPAVITGIIDRLERRALVRREPDPDDRRRLRLALTETGLAASMVVERALTEDLAAQLSQATPQELDELGRALELLQRTFAALEEKTPRPVEMSAGDSLPTWDDDSSSRADALITGGAGTR
jgi:DNA-binding MarR family transcriptional regulator